jgi:hypothetical protein
MRADVSTQSVLKLWGRSDSAELLGDAIAVSCDHYDVDGLLSVWSMTDPESVLQHVERVERTALTGDFDIYLDAGSMRSCLALSRLSEHQANEIMHQFAVRDTDLVTGELFRRMLKDTVRCVTEPEAYRDAWAAEAGRIESGLRLLDRGKSHVNEVPDASLAYVTGEPVHPWAANSRSECNLMAETTMDRRHRMHFRYESFVDLASRSTVPRIRGEMLAERLNRVERSGRWMCEPPDTATPCLQLYTGAGAPSPSSLAYDEFLTQVINFAREAAVNSELRWHDRTQWLETSNVRPPSLSSR